mgnify:CR=1 FL=1
MMSELTTKIEAMEKDLSEVTAFGDWLYERYGETTYGKNVTPITVAKDKIITAEKNPSETRTQLAGTQNALRLLHNAVIKSRSVNDPLGMASALEEAGKWF